MPLLLQSLAEQHMVSDGAGFEANGLAVMVDALFNAAGGLESSGIIAVKIRFVRQFGEGLAYQVQSDFRAADLIREHAQQIEGVGLARPLLENLPIERLGLS